MTKTQARWVIALLVLILCVAAGTSLADVGVLASGVFMVAVPAIGAAQAWRRKKDRP